MQTALLDLKSLLGQGLIILNASVPDMASLSRRILFISNLIDLTDFDLEFMVQSLFDEKFIENPQDAQKLLWVLGLPHFHHHEKRSVTKTASSISLTKQGLHPSASFVMNSSTRRGLLQEENFLLNKKIICILVIF